VTRSTVFDEGTGRRWRGDRGTAFVAALVIMFAVTGAAALYLARDVNGRVADRSAAQSIAFQAARSGAQQLDVGRLRTDGAVVIEVAAARRAARRAVRRLAEQYGVAARIVDQFSSDARRTWHVVLAVDGPRGGEARVTGVAHAEVGS